MWIPVLVFGHDVMLISLFLRTPQHNLLVQNLHVANRTLLCGRLSVQFDIKTTGVEVFDTGEITSGTDESKHPTSETDARARTHTHTHTHTQHNTHNTHTHIHTHKRIHSLKPSGHYMYSTVVTICTTSLTFTIATFYPRSIFTVLCTDLRTKSGHIALPDWLCKRQAVCFLRGTSCAVTETSDHGVSRTSSSTAHIYSLCQETDLWAEQW